jgi:hypothetical protein
LLVEATAQTTLMLPLALQLLLLRAELLMLLSLLLRW